MKFYEDPDILKVFLLGKALLNIVSILVPVLLILLCSYDVFKTVISNEEQALQGMIKKIIKVLLVGQMLIKKK